MPEMDGQMTRGLSIQGACSQQSAEGGAQPMETQDVSGKGIAVAKGGASGAASRFQSLPYAPRIGMPCSSYRTSWRYAVRLMPSKCSTPSDKSSKLKCLQQQCVGQRLSTNPIPRPHLSWFDGSGHPISAGKAAHPCAHTLSSSERVIVLPAVLRKGSTGTRTCQSASCTRPACWRAWAATRTSPPSLWTRAASSSCCACTP